MLESEPGGERHVSGALDARTVLLREQWSRARNDATSRRLDPMAAQRADLRLCLKNSSTGSRREGQRCGVCERARSDGKVSWLCLLAARGRSPESTAWSGAFASVDRSSRSELMGAVMHCRGVVDCSNAMCGVGGGTVGSGLFASGSQTIALGLDGRKPSRSELR